ncbi:MAG TPA: single-stranded DNA-binding protein [Dermatophilaceae bacterium]|nr:single-stranded DNA-binding protein [Dermatophilaceae bacterium]
MNEITITVTGNVCADPVLHSREGGAPFATFRVASTARHFNRREGAWVDGATTFVQVIAFDALATNVASSVKRGQPVFVQGRLRLKDFVTGEGKEVQSVEIAARHVGHDLARGQGTFERSYRQAVDPYDPMDAPEVRAGVHAQLNGRPTAGSEPPPLDAPDPDLELDGSLRDADVDSDADPGSDPGSGADSDADADRDAFADTSYLVQRAG